MQLFTCLYLKLGTSTLITKINKLLRRTFCPGFAAFTFPMAIGATALFKLADWMQTMNIDMQFINQIHHLAVFELLVATAVVCYVAGRYLFHFNVVKFQRLATSQ